MRRRRSRWSDLLASVGQAGLDLVQAEYDVVSTEIRSSGRVLARSLLLLVIGLFAVFWAIGALALVLVEVGSLWLPRWGAALCVLAVFLALGLTFAVLARKRLHAIELPAETVRRRLDEHREWWEGRIASLGPVSRRPADAPAKDPETVAGSADDPEETVGG